MDQIGDRELATGQAIQIYVDKKNFMKQELHGGRKYYTDYRKESLLLLTMHDKFVRHAEINLQNIAKKVKIYFMLLFKYGLHRRARFSRTPRRTKASVKSSS